MHRSPKAEMYNKIIIIHFRAFQVIFGRKSEKDELLSFHLPLLRTLFKQRTIIYTGPHFFNSLDESFKLSPSLFSFKRKLKSSQINNYNVHP